jgi:hypothetical protein
MLVSLTIPMKNPARPDASYHALSTPQRMEQVTSQFKPMIWKKD